MQKFVTNLAFENYEAGEIIEAEPAQVADWLESRFISPVDERGDRIIEHEGAPSVDVTDASPAPVTSTAAATSGSRSTDDD
jgi:hypothetical protein